MPQKASLDLTVQFSLAISFISFKCYSPSVKSSSNLELQHLAPSQQQAASRLQRLQDQRGAGGLGSAASWLCHLAPPPSQPLVNCSSDCTFCLQHCAINPSFKQNPFICLWVIEKPNKFKKSFSYLENVLFVFEDGWNPSEVFTL